MLARFQLGPWAWALSFALLLGAVLISGMRAGWLTMALVLAVYFLLMMKRENRELRKTVLTIPVIAILVLTFSYFASPLFQERLDISRAFAIGGEAAVDASSMERVPIFATALKMYTEHPVNGVGVRAFPKAYMVYAEPDDIHIRKSGGVSGALHAHNFILEVMADTGTIGLLGLLAALWFLWRHRARVSPAERHDAFPFALAVLLVLFVVVQRGTESAAQIGRRVVANGSLSSALHLPSPGVGGQRMQLRVIIAMVWALVWTGCTDEPPKGPMLDVGNLAPDAAGNTAPSTTTARLQISVAAELPLDDIEDFEDAIAAVAMTVRELAVQARYTRRGGLDICPWRSTESGTAPGLRMSRQ